MPPPTAAAAAAAMYAAVVCQAAAAAAAAAEAEGWWPAAAAAAATGVGCASGEGATVVLVVSFLKDNVVVLILQEDKHKMQYVSRKTHLL